MAEVKIRITGRNFEYIKALAEDAIADINCMDGDHIAFIETVKEDK